MKHRSYNINVCFITFYKFSVTVVEIKMNVLNMKFGNPKIQNMHQHCNLYIKTGKMKQIIE